MENVKALFIIVNMGFGSKAVEIAHEAGAEGAVVINALGTGMARKSLLGIPAESEKEIVLTLASEEIAEKVVAAIKEKSGVESPAHGICLIMPIGRMMHFVKAAPRAKEE
jgi:nitrogen regulatory protein PII